MAEELDGRPPASPQIHKKLIKMWNNSYKEPLGDRRRPQAPEG